MVPKNIHDFLGFPMLVNSTYQPTQINPPEKTFSQVPVPQMFCQEGHKQLTAVWGLGQHGNKHGKGYHLGDVFWNSMPVTLK